MRLLNLLPLAVSHGGWTAYKHKARRHFSFLVDLAGSMLISLGTACYSKWFR